MAEEESKPKKSIPEEASKFLEKHKAGELSGGCQA